MDYDVRLLDDDELPPEIEWAFVKRSDLLTFCIKRSALTEDNIADAWAVARSMRPSSTVETRRAPVRLVR